MMAKQASITTALLLAALSLAMWFGLINVQSTTAQEAPAGTIQNLIDLAPDGGTVNIPAGTYNESLTVNKTLTLTGVSSATTAIVAVTNQRVITVTAGHNLRLENLTVTGGHPSGGGGGVYIDNGNLQIFNCRIIDNSASYGGGVYQDHSGRVDVINSWIALNTSSNHGGGLFVSGSAALTNTQVLSNSAGWHGGGLHVDSGRTDLNGGLFSNNRALGDNGGAVNVNNGLSISGTQFISNTAAQDGGGLLQWNSGQPVMLNNVRVERNQSKGNGGGLWARGNVTVTNSVLISNTADSHNATDTYGGGVYLSGGTLNVISSTFRANQAKCTGCAAMYGGGLYVDTALSATVQGSWFETNYAWQGGGLFSLQAIAIRRTTFQNNSAGYGGGVGGADVDIQNSDFLSNTAANVGGGLRLSGKATVSGSRFIRNTALYGGGVDLASGANATLINNVITDNRASYSAGGLYTEAATLQALHNTLARNSSGDGTGATIGTDWSGTYGSTAVLTNTILVSQTLGVSVTVHSAATLNGVLWYSNTANIRGIGVFTVTNALTGTPAFASDGYHLTANSKAINAGVSAGVINDLDGEARDAAPDFGADEYRTCWARLNNDTTDYGHAQVAVDASTQATDVVKVAGYCPGVQPHGGLNQAVYLSKMLTVRGGYTTTDWLTSNPIAYPTVLDALHLGRVIYISGGSRATVENLIIRGGLINGGGGVYNNGAQVTLANVIVRDNAVPNGSGGGGLCVSSSGTLTVSASLVTSNTASYGGGIFNSGGKLVLINSTLSGNQSSTGDPTLDGGGALDQWGAAPSATIINSTIVSNTAAFSNVARSGIWLENGTLAIQNSIVAHNGVTNNLRIENGAVFTSTGYNLTNSGAGTPFTAATDLRNTNPLLGPLQDNGGAMWTHALLSGSPAIDRIPFGVNGCGTTLITDQRGQPRPGSFTHLCDIGAYEAQGIYNHVYLPVVIK